MEFTIKAIDDLCTKITDGSHFSPEHDEKGIFPMYSVKDMEYNNFSNADCKMIGQDVFEKLAKSDCRPLKDDILIAKDGSYLKYAFKVNNTLNACILSSIAILRPNQNVIDPDYFVYLLRTKSIKGAMANFVSGSALPRIILSDFKKMKLKMNSDLLTQKRIASILSAYDNLIENNNKRIKLLEQMAENLYKEWFVRFRFPGHETTPLENGIPMGWSINRFDTAATLINGRAYLMPELLSEGKYRIVRVGNFSGKDEWFYSDMELESDKYCEQGDLLYKWACNFGPEIWNEEKVIYHYHIWKVVPKNNVNKAYLYFYLKTSTPLWMGGTNGTAMVHITKESMEKKKMVVPPKSILDQFDNIVGPMIRNRLSLLKHNENLIKQRDLLLPRLMSGKLAV